MPILHITYHLGNHDDTAPAVTEAIKAMGPSLHYAPSSWLVDSIYSATKAHHLLGTLLNPDDRLLILTITPKRPRAAQGFSDQAAEWLQHNL